MQNDKENKFKAKNYFNFIHCCALANVMSFQYEFKCKQIQLDKEHGNIDEKNETSFNNSKKK